MKRIARILAIAVLILLAISGGGAFWIHRILTTPYRAYAEEKLLIEVPKGASVTTIASTLESRGVVKHGWLLRGIFKWKHTEGESKAGDYVFDRPLTPLEVYEKLMKGETLYTVVTIPEGSTVFDIQRIFDERQIGDATRFEQSRKDVEVLAKLGEIEPSAQSLEGFLFPETYFFEREQSVQNAFRIMLREFLRRYGDAERKRAGELGFTTLEVVTLASLVEEETGRPSERPLIAGVFHNRLRLRMLLQCDPTVIYALQLAGKYKGFLTRSDLKFPSPYNTYTTPGLPPGPICNPGADAIRAVLYPEETDKLYFVSRNDGTHHFSATLAEHNRAVQKYQRNR